ncbi:MAG TPA: hypothetical protein DCD96_07440, partial [Flavobacteriales bacterium]|nr:hypothetical protein [Flavobacteriales bacterium]
ESKPQEMIDLAKQKKQEEQDKEKNAALDKQYNDFMKQGETDLAANQYDKAITSFEAAKKVKPAESKPDEMIELARKKKQELADKEANSKKAKDLVTKGDAEMPKKNYDGAIGFYEEAVGLDPLPEYKSKLDAARKAKTDAEAADKAKQAQEAKYQEFITKGDAELGNSEYDKAIASYNEALKIKPGEKYPTDQIAIAIKKKADAEKNAAQEKQYTDLMKQGETDFNAKQWDKAITSYEAAKKVKPAESKPQEMIDLAKQKKQEEVDAEKNAALDKQYNDLMKQGDVDLAANQYDKAITSYEAAKKVKPTESKPQEMIDLARQKKADEMDKQARINKAKDLVAKGDNELTKKQYDNAISHYEEAIGLDPKPEYQSKLDAARKAKSDEELANKSKAEKETQYKDFLAQGDDAYRNGEWDKAISAYNSALAIKPGEKYPTEQVTLCKQKKSDAEAAAAKDKEYNDFMAKADADLDAGNFDKAIENYTKASGVKPTERRPGEQIAIAKQRKAEKEANAASEAEKKAKYKAAMDEGVKFQTEGKFDQAIQKYEEALNYQPGDKNAQDQLEKAKRDKDSKEQDKRRMYDDLVKFADKEFNAGNYADAKGYYDRAANVLKNEQYPKDRSIESQKKLDEKNALDAKRSSYNEALKKADDAFNTSNWQASIPLYEAAAKIIPDELYPGQQIEKAKQKIQEQKDREADKVRLEKEYAAKIKEADQAFKGNQLDEAINFYNEALAIKKDEAYPKAQIDLINKKKEELRQKDEQAKIDAEYKEIIIRADEAFNAKQWDQSIDLYTSAKGKKPSEKYPSDQIVKAKAKKAEEAANTANAAKLEEQRQKYLAKIKEADDLFNAERYEECKKVYAEAAGIKSDETYPQEQIDKANARMKELAEANIRKQYDLIIAQADKDFDAGNLSDAKGYYERALKIRPNDQHPKNRIDEINKRIQADASNAEKRKKYETIVKRADGELNKSDFDKSIASYTEALTVFPDESYPKEKIEEARRLKAEKDALASAKEKYKAEMNKGMESYNSGTFDKAIVHFENALGHVPNDSEATKMLEKARKELKERGDFLKQQYTALINAADENFNSGKLDDAEGLYNRALKLMPNEQYPKDQLAKIDAKRKLSSGASDYNKVIAEANTKFNTKDYSSARELYVKASEIQPTVDYPKKRIKEIDDLLKTTNSGGNTNPGPVVGNTNNTKVIIEKNYGTPINIDIKAAQEMIAQASREKEEDRHKLTDSTKLLTEELQRKSGDKQSERLEENAEEFVKMKEKYDEFATNGERNLQDNIASYQNLKENREEKNSELSGNTDERLLDKSKEMEQIKTDFVYAEVGTDAVRQENIKTTAETKENRYNKEAELEGNTNEKRQETAEKLRQDNFQLQDQMAEKDETIRTQNANNLAEFKEERYNKESQLEGNTNEKRQERSEQLTQDQFKLQDQLAEKDETVRTVKANEIAELKEERYVKESELEGNTNEKRQARSEQLTQDNFRLQDQMAEKDVVRIKNEDSIAHFKEDRYEDESKMEGNTDIKRINKSEELTQNNYQLQDQLAKTDVVRQENERTISTTKEERYVKESELEGNTNEKRQETAEKLRQDNFQLQDQMAEKDETIRTQNANNLAEFKEERYNKESQLEGNTDKKRQEKAEQLRQDNFSLQDQMAVKDETVRNRNANNLAEFKEERYIKESELEGNTDAKRIDRSEQLTQDQFKLEDQMAGRDVVRQENEKTVATVKEERYVKESNLSGNTDDRLQNKKDSLVAQTNRQEGQFSDLDKMKDKNHQELEAKKQGYNEQTDQNAKTSDNNRQRNQDQLQSQQYRTNDPRANTTGVLVKEQSFQRNDPSGKPMEVTVQRIVRKGNQTSEYLMIINRTGNSYFKDGSPISETQWSTETGVPKE